MGFLNNLAKGFVRSTVNQVGRDSGKVVSNKIYGNKHSTPINANLNNAIDTNSNAQINNENEQITNRISSANDTFKNIIIFLFAFFMPIIGIPVVLYKAIKYSKKSKITIQKTERVNKKVNDKRYKGGYRLETNNILVPVEVDATSEELKYMQKKSKNYYIIALVTIGIYILGAIGSSISA